MTWRIGASTGGCPDRPVLEVVDAIHEAGIDAVEVGTPPGHFDPWRQTEVQALRECLRGNGIRAVDLWMRHTETLDQILHRLPTSDDMRPRNLAALRRQEVVQ